MEWERGRGEGKRDGEREQEREGVGGRLVGEILEEPQIDCRSGVR